MPEVSDKHVVVESGGACSIVSLKVAGKSAAAARDRLQLAAGLHFMDSEPISLCVAPDHWLLISCTATPDDLIENCRVALDEIVHNAVDQSDGLSAIRITGPGARELLATDCGLDLRPARFPAGSCCRTRMARISTVVVADGLDSLAIYVDRSVETYIREWLEDSISISGRLMTADGR